MARTKTAPTSAEPNDLAPANAEPEDLAPAHAEPASAEPNDLAPTNAEPAAPPPVWKFVANRDLQGRPDNFHSAIPARDLFERDMARMTDEQLKLVEASQLYQRSGDEPATAKE